MNRYIGFAALLLLAVSCTGKSNNADASGAFEATEVIVSSEASGRILTLNVTDGDTLQQGVTVGTIDSTQLVLKRQQLLATTQVALSRRPNTNKQIASLQAQIAKAEQERSRMSALVSAKAGNQKQLDDAESTLQVLRKELSALLSTLSLTDTGAQSEAQSIDYQIRQTEDQLVKCRIVNPIEGVVLVKYAEPNEITAIGKPLYKIANTRTLFLRAYITADQLSTIKEGAKVTVYSDFGKDDRRPHEGTVTWVSAKAEFTPKGIQTKDERANLVYAVKIRVANDGYLKIGQYGEVAIQN